MSKPTFNEDTVKKIEVLSQARFMLEEALFSIGKASGVMKTAVPDNEYEPYLRDIFGRIDEIKNSLIDERLRIMYLKTKKDEYKEE